MTITTGFHWPTVFLLIITLVFLDKFLTVQNLMALQKNFPETNHLEAEKNPMARWFFQKMGLIWGSVVFGIISIGLFLLALFIFGSIFTFFWPNTGYSIALWLLTVWYMIVVGNNLFFLLKYSRVVP